MKYKALFLTPLLLVVACNSTKRRADNAFSLLKATGQAVDHDLAAINHTQPPPSEPQLAEFRAQFQGDDLVRASAEALSLMATRVANAQVHSLESRLQGQLGAYQRALVNSGTKFRTHESAAKLQAAIIAVQAQVPEARRQTQLLNDALAKIIKAQEEMAGLLPKG